MGSRGGGIRAQGIAAALAGLVCAAGCAYVVSRTWESHQSLDATGVRTVRVWADRGSVAARGEERRTVEVHFTRACRAADQGRAEVYLAGLGKVQRRRDELIVDARTGGVPRGVGGVRVDVDLRVPARVGLELAVAAGDITAEALAASVSARTSNGRVYLRDVRGDVSVASSNGDVLLQDILGDIRAEVSNGRVRIVRAATGSCRVSTANGDIRAELSGRGDVDWYFASSNGDIVLSLPWDLSATVDVQVPAGGVQSDFPLQQDGRRAWGRLGDGGGRITIAASRGRVVLKMRR